MSVRTIFLLLALPLFLLLAAINSVLLYREDTADMEAGLREEALAAAVTVAEFAKASPNPYADLAEPRRLATLHNVNREITGLDALYLTGPGRQTLNLLSRPIALVREGRAPAQADVLGTWEDAKGRHLITALAPVGRGTMVVADIDAEPLARRFFHLKRMSLALVAGAAVLAMLIGLIVARRVIGELRRTRTIIETHGDRQQDAPLGIREVRDLADAVHLIDASVASELRRLGRRGGEGDPAIGIAAARARHFPDLSMDHAGVALAIRLLPSGPAGSFYVCKAQDDGLLFAVGEMAGDPAAAFTSAVAFASYLSSSPADKFTECVASAKQVFNAKTVHVSGLHAGAGGLVTLGLYGNSQAMRDYVERNPGLDPETLTTDLAALFPDAGIIATASERVAAVTR